MKDLSLAKPLAIVMVGLPGAGKSFFARQFSTTFGSAVVSYDRIGYELFNATATTRKQLTIVDRMADYQIEELLKTKRSFFIDGGYNTEVKRRALREKVHKAEYGMLVIWVQTEAQACRVRSLKRSAQKEGDMYNTSLSTEEFDSLVASFQAPRPQEHHVVISGKHTYATQSRMILKKLAGPKVEAKPSNNHETRTTIRVVDTAQPTRPEPQRRNVTIN